MKGKAKCKLLKQIRRKIAEENDISYVTSECKYQGDCSGTCPKCEAEVRYLEDELRKRQNAGKAVAVAGIAAAMVVTASGCVSSVGGAPLYPEQEISQTDATRQTEEEIRGGATVPTEDTTVPTEGELVDGEIVDIMGEVPEDETDPMYETTAGVPMPTDPTADELMGEPSV